MKILVLTGSPHIQGSTALLADEFCIGATEAGHEIVRFDAAGLNIHPCLGCLHCHDNNGTCVYDDDMTAINQQLLISDALVLVSPLYYFDVTAQLKTAIDRFFCINNKLRSKPIKLYVICAAGNQNEWVYDGLIAHISTLCRFMNWQLGGMLLANGAPTRQHILNSEYAALARKTGREL